MMWDFAETSSPSFSLKKAQDYLFKLVLIGDSGVGKSSLLLRFTNNVVSKSFNSTIGVDFRFRTVSLDGKTAKLHIWDTAGQERFKTITSAYYKGADGILIVFDVTSLESYKHADEWFAEVERYTSEESCTKILIGNKIDKTDQRVVSHEMAKEHATALKMEYVETSIMEGDTVEAAFIKLSASLFTQARLDEAAGLPVSSYAARNNPSGLQGLKLNQNNTTRPSGSCC